LENNAGTEFRLTCQIGTIVILLDMLFQINRTTIYFFRWCIIVVQLKKPSLRINWAICYIGTNYIGTKQSI